MNKTHVTYIEKQVLYVLNPKCASCRNYIKEHDIRSSGIPYKTCPRCRERNRQNRLKAKAKKLAQQNCEEKC